MDHRKLVQQRLGEPGRGARGGRRQERGQRGVGGGEGGGLRKPCLKIPFHRQEFISWGLIALELLTAVSPPPQEPQTVWERSVPLLAPLSLGRPCPSTGRMGHRVGWPPGPARNSPPHRPAASGKGTGMRVGDELVLKPVSILFSPKLHIYLGWAGESGQDNGSSKAAQTPHLGVCLLGSRSLECVPPTPTCSLPST